uniref:Uncharacterized protein n=1 Tax=Rhizophora mucronata TaxID=61149 RepID=A0A2P2QKB4_RHIMU
MTYVRTFPFYHSSAACFILLF